MAVGPVAGLRTALVAIRILGSALAGLEAGHLGSTGLAAGLVMITAAVACWIPARRAMRTDRIAALREE